jgi:hypothetical protein
MTKGKRERINRKPAAAQPEFIGEWCPARILSERSLPTDLVSVEANVEFEGAHRHFSTSFTTGARPVGSQQQ